MTELRFQDVSKIYPDGTCAVEHVSLTVEDGQLLVLVGPSGCGKTTLLRMVAGLEEITEGTIEIDGRVINDVSPKDRDVAMVFQNYALYPHMTVAENMGFGLKLRHVRSSTRKSLVTVAAASLSLTEQLAKKPRHLSGGQRQRVAMGRAMVREPKAFLLDEPLSNLDAKLRVQMRTELARMQRDLGVTTIYVTHDQVEAMTLGDVVAVMRAGVIQQVAVPDDLYTRPRNLFVAGFVGSPSMNLMRCELVRRDSGAPAIDFGAGPIDLPSDQLARHPRLRDGAMSTVAVGIRPEAFDDAATSPPGAGDATLDVTVELRERLGPETYVYFTLNTPPISSDELLELAADTDISAVDAMAEQADRGVTRLVARLNPETLAREGEQLRLVLKTAKLHFFDLETGETLATGKGSAGEAGQLVQEECALPYGGIREVGR